ncbi:DUF397 domain-containing protein [Streptomyces hygroscopicus]|uniref:DUF397 domain-containing protein n=1 Tax=Streptomyces hygroscopicus TaxID=1912 RepID=UPI00099ED002
MRTHQWQKSSYSAQGNACLYVSAPDNATIRLRESDEPDTILTTTPTALAALIRSAKAGRLDHLGAPCGTLPAGAFSGARRNRIAASRRCTAGHRLPPSPT